MKHVLDVFEDFIRAHFDKLLLTFLFMSLTSMALTISDPQWVAWAHNSAATVLGGIILLTTGQSRGRNGNGKPPEPQPPVPPKETP